ncbi:MAG: hypothetical protein WCL39_12320, partial [Armatimonadota bacterium]
RRFDGANWTIPQNWGSWSVHEAAFDASNIMHFLYVDSGVSPWELYYSAYNRATDSRSPGQLISAGANTMKVDFASMAMEASGAVHTIWEERKNPGDAGVYYSTNFSLNAPADVVSFSVNASDGVNRLYWRNPGSANFNGTMIRFKTTGFPTGPGDGTLLVDKVATLNSSDSTTHSGLTNGQTYYYAAFTHDALGHYSTCANFAAAPHKLRCSEIKRFENNTLIDLTDKIVTASFPAQSAIYIQEPDRSSGIRVTTAVASSYQPGDIVSISAATIDTRIVSGVPAERMIKNCTLTKTGVTMAPVPLTFKGINIGGEDIQPYVPGVYGAIGLNNVGQLVKLIGLVRDKISTYLYVDDGSGVVDISGGLGMLVQTPTNPPAPQIGQYISVIGVVEGSVELFSLQSRRFIRARSNADIVIYQ